MIHWVFMGATAAVKAVVAHVGGAHVATATVATTHGVAVPHVMETAAVLGGHSVATQSIVGTAAHVASPLAVSHATAGVASVASATHSPVVSAAFNHLETQLAHEAGKQAAKSITSKALAEKVLAPSIFRAIPIHHAIAGSRAVIAAGNGAGIGAGGGAAIGIGGGAAIVGGAPAATWQLSPATITKAKKLAKAFAEGFVVQKIRGERSPRLDLQNIKRWFEHEANTTGPLKFTATGKVKSGNFVPSAPTQNGPYVVLQGLFDPKTGQLRNGRIVRGIESLSESVRNSHGGDGIALYPPLKTAA